MPHFKFKVVCCYWNYHLNKTHIVIKNVYYSVIDVHLKEWNRCTANKYNKTKNNI